jgi:hypothetical protein
MYSNQAWLAATLTVWPGCGRASSLDDALTALPGEFVIVPDADERPARARVLQLTKANLTGRGSFGSGAVIVRPTRLPFFSSSVKRYQ